MTPIQVFSTCPPSSAVPQHEYASRVTEIARWCENAGCKGILVYSDNSLLDPWLVSHLIVQHTRSLSPLVAVQPVYMHPYTVAKQITSLAWLHERQVVLNMVAGGFVNDLEALDDQTPHDRRYDRVVEYTRIVIDLLTHEEPLTREGQFHRVAKLKLSPRIADSLMPDVLVSGSSDAGRAAARALGATAIRYPQPASQEEVLTEAGDRLGIRVGIIARSKASDAWRVARERFPEDRRGQLTRNLASRVSDSSWHKQLMAVEAEGSSPYWLVPFRNYRTMCPYLVGSYAEVGAELARYFSVGCGIVILDVPSEPDDLAHAFTAFEAAAVPVS